MSQLVSANHVAQYSANVYHLSQQKGSKLQAFVRNESQKGKKAFYDNIGAVTAVKKTSRHSDTPQFDTPHERRMVTMDDYEWSDLVDDQDKIRMIYDPTSYYAEAAMWAFGRAKDDVIISAMGATAYTGEAGTGTASLANANKVICFDGSATTGAGLNIDSLKAIKKKFMDNDVDESIPLHIAVNPAAIFSMLNETEVTSADYNTVKALVKGEINSFMGFTFHWINRLAANGSVSGNKATGEVGSGNDTTLAASAGKVCYAWAQDGVLLATGEDVMSRVDERADKSYSAQVYARMSIGGTRMEEKKVVEFYSKG